MNLYLTALALAFGQGSPNIFFASFVRLGVAIACTIWLSWLFGKNMPPIALPVGQWITFVGIMCIIHLATTIALVLSMGMVHAGYSVFERLLVYLPISQFKRVTVLLIPEGIVAALTTLLISCPLLTWTARQGLGVIFTILASIIGCLGSLGMLHMLGRRQWMPHIVLGAGMLLAEILLLRHFIFHPSAWAAISILLCLLVVAPIVLLWHGRQYFVENIIYQKTARNNMLCGNSPRLWFIKKMIRSRIQRISFLVTFALSGIAAFVFSRQPLTDPSLLALLTAILGAAFISDVRALSRKNRPAEITALTGTIRFVSVELASAFAIGTIALLPLILVPLFIDPGSVLSNTLPQILLGFSVGFFVSTLVVPEGRNMSAQCLANLLAIGLLALPPIFQSPTATSPLFQYALSVSFLVAAYIIEYHRNPYKWRTYVS